MNKNKYIAIMLINCLIIGIISFNTFAMDVGKESPVGEYLETIKKIENNYYFAGKGVIEESCSNDSNSKNKLAKEIKFYLSEISELKNNMNDYLATIKNNKVEYRNVEALLLVSDYFRIGLEELLIILEAQNDSVKYNSLESYFYSKVLAKQSISFVEGQLK
ncbi:MAG: hypothetical protein ACRDA3_02890 [Peptostreptococcaceae bacterium]